MSKGWGGRVTEALDVQMCGRFADMVEAHDYAPVHSGPVSVGFNLISAKDGSIIHYLCYRDDKVYVGWMPRNPTTQWLFDCYGT